MNVIFNKPCLNIDCTAFVRQDEQAVIFKELKEMEVKIQIPDNCELIKDGDTYVVKEKNSKPRSWEEFCKSHSIKKGEVFINNVGIIESRCSGHERCLDYDKNLCTSKKEAEAFLALMQLRQLRKAWVGDWEQSKEEHCGGISYSVYHKELTVTYSKPWLHITLSFPTKEMAFDFLDCFRDLCETAKILL